MATTNSSSLIVEEPSAGALIGGYLGLLLSCASFGTMFTPLRRKNTKDGFFVQWVECSVVLVVGFFINIIRGFPPFQWIAAIGGILYATGNVFSVPAVNGLGMGIAFLIWGSMQVIVGWSVSRFGLFSFLPPTEVKHNALNYAGMVITLISGFLFIFVKHTNTKSVSNVNDADPTENSHGNKTRESSGSDASNERKHFLKKLKMAFNDGQNKKFRYVVMTMALATLHGLMMTPIEILKKRNPSNDYYRVFDYMWSFYSTVFVASTIYFVLYCLIRREKAYVRNDLVIPAVGYGILWTSGMTLWILSSDVLLQVIAFPIVTRLPAIISALLDVIVYKSITGRNNLIYLASAVGVGITGVVLIALSNHSF